MPASVRLSATEIIVATRRREGARRWIQTYVSENNGSSWSNLSVPVRDAGIGNPAMIRLADGRLCLLYGYRGQPYSIRATLSSDGGRT